MLSYIYASASTSTSTSIYWSIYRSSGSCVFCGKHPWIHTLFLKMQPLTIHLWASMAVCSLRCCSCCTNPDIVIFVVIVVLTAAGPPSPVKRTNGVMTDFFLHKVSHAREAVMFSRARQRTLIHPHVYSTDETHKVLDLTHTNTLKMKKTDVLPVFLFHLK